MHLLLVEDDVVIARELQLRWRSRGWEVQHCATLAEADQASRSGLHDIVVLDLGLPDGDGLGWLQRLRERDPSVPVLVLTARASIGERVRGLHAGADDYLVKPFAVEELDARVAALDRRLHRHRGQALRLGRLSWMGSEGRALVDEQALDLSPREFEVLGLLIQRAPRLVTKRALVDALAERNLEVGDSVAEVYVSRLRRKLLGSGVAIRTLRGFGYLLALEEPVAGGRGG
jgi:DNA-binding response OmpR family regulator